MAVDDERKSTGTFWRRTVRSSRIRLHGNTSVAAGYDFHRSISVPGKVASFLARPHVVLCSLQLLLDLLVRLPVDRVDFLHLVGQKLAAVTDVDSSF